MPAMSDGVAYDLESETQDSHPEFEVTTEFGTSVTVTTPCNFKQKSELIVAKKTLGGKRKSSSKRHRTLNNLFGKRLLLT